MLCTKCLQPIEEKSGFFHTKKGAHHFRCGVANLPDKPSSEIIEKMIELYDHRGPAETKFEAMTKVANLALMNGK